ncbi:MAG TPA: hypothetical protein VMR75_00675, partial [Candidatus Saccharimonadales bacterium]|nr:hypothetical protein [Candidatus Saccharimonadales bacterium]
MADISNTKHSIEVTAKASDARATQLLKHLQPLTGAALASLAVTDVYTIQKSLHQKEVASIAAMLVNPVSEQAVWSSG